VKKMRIPTQVPTKKAWALVVLVLLLGCSKLSKGRATDLLSGYLESNENTLSLDVGRVDARCIYEPDVAKYVHSKEPMTIPGTFVAVKAGYATVTPDGAGFWKVSLTAKGQAVVDSQHSSPVPHTVRNGCDFQTMLLAVARPRLVRVLQVTADDRLAVAQFEWKWVPTELGAALRSDGAVYQSLTETERRELAHLLGARILSSDFPLSLPVPADDMSNYERSKAGFKKHNDGWQLDHVSYE
jgi:hypothetical protein